MQRLNSKEQHVSDTNAGKLLSSAAKDVQLSLVLKKWATFKYRLELWPPHVYKQKKMLVFKQLLQFLFKELCSIEKGIRTIFNF